MTPRILIAVALLLPLMTTCAPSQPAAVSYYVATNGNDQWSGKLAAPNAGGTDGPFATIAGARDAIRALKAQAGLTAPITVQVRGGSYYLPQPLVFMPQDSGTQACPITYAAYQGETPIISGGAPITNWRTAQVNGHAAWTAQVPDVAQGQWYFRELWVNNGRRLRTRVPREGLYRIAELLQRPGSIPFKQGQDRVIFADQDIKQWRNLNDVEVMAFHFWIEERLPIASVDSLSHAVTFTRPSLFRLTDGQNPEGARYYVENVFEALDSPGQWYLDRPTGTLYYIPQPGEDPQRATVIAPRLAQVVQFNGDAANGQYVEYINFQGLSFMHTEWTLPAQTAAYKQAAVNVPGAILWTGARSCALRDCTIAHIGNYGVEMGVGCQGNTIKGNAIWDLGAGGVKIGFDSSGTVVSDNHIYDGGYMFASAVGVWIGNSAHNEVSHNVIHRLYYTGISCGWTWGYRASPTQDNHVEYNVIYQIGRGLLDDMGGIYNLGVQPGTTIRNNLIHDVWSAHGRGRGIYLDEGSTGILVENNIVLRVDDATLIQNYGRDNMIQNNIFALGKQVQIRRARPEAHRSFTIQRNIFYFDEGELLGGKWGDGKYTLDNNVYYNAAGAPIDFAGQSFAQWQGTGQDLHSVIADPRLSGIDANKVVVEIGSPAYSLGFKAIDMSTVGRRGGATIPSPQD
jgi:hypothetical protein